MRRLDFLREKVKRNVVIIDNEYRRRWDYIPLRDNVEDYSCSVTFELTNPTDYEEFQGLCNYVEAHSNHDGKIRIRTTDNFTCRVRIQFAADSDYTEYSIKLGMAVLVPASARGWNRITAKNQNVVTDNTTNKTTTKEVYGYTGVSCDDTMSFTPFTAKDLEEFQTTINTTVGKEPGSFGLMEVVNTLSDSIGGILNVLGNLLNLSTGLGAGLLALAIVAGVIVGIVI